MEQPSVELEVTINRNYATNKMIVFVGKCRTEDSLVWHDQTFEVYFDVFQDSNLHSPFCVAETIVIGSVLSKVTSQFLGQVIISSG